MREVTPQAYLFMSSRLEGEVNAFFRDIGIPDWLAEKRKETYSDGDIGIESAGRLCYRSWIPHDPYRPDASNPNVDRIREGNVPYIGNIIKQKHGSTFQHVYVTFIFHNVSRVMTHELIRHTAGCAYSQESLRYVRLDALKAWVPGEARTLGPQVVDCFIRGILTLETLQSEFIHLVGLDTEKDFKRKKILTSLARRLAPIGLATSIMATMNLRAWRHVIAQRSDPAAEEEMRLLIGGTVAPKLKLMYPAAFQDMHRSETDELSWSFDSTKI
jgi:thymidylate synthase (FAD)